MIFWPGPTPMALSSSSMAQEGRTKMDLLQISKAVDCRRSTSGSRLVGIPFVACYSRCKHHENKDPDQSSGSMELYWAKCQSFVPTPAGWAQRNPGNYCAMSLAGREAHGLRPCFTGHGCGVGPWCVTRTLSCRKLRGRHSAKK